MKQDVHCTGSSYCATRKQFVGTVICQCGMRVKGALPTNNTLTFTWSERERPRYKVVDNHNGSVVLRTTNKLEIERYLRTFGVTAVKATLFSRRVRDYGERLFRLPPGRESLDLVGKSAQS